MTDAASSTLTVAKDLVFCEYCNKYETWAHVAGGEPHYVLWCPGCDTEKDASHFAEDDRRFLWCRQCREEDEQERLVRDFRVRRALRILTRWTIWVFKTKLMRNCDACSTFVLKKHFRGESSVCNVCSLAHMLKTNGRAEAARGRISEWMRKSVRPYWFAWCSGCHTCHRWFQINKEGLCYTCHLEDLSDVVLPSLDRPDDCRCKSCLGRRAYSIAHRGKIDKITGLRIE